jgi:anti-sigma B factor antagonist
MSHDQAGNGNAGSPPIRGFGLAEADIEAGAREICVEGELDLAVADQLQDAIDRSAAALTVINLEACDFIDSTGIAVIVRAHREKAGDGARVVAHSPNDGVRRILALTGLLDNGLVFEDRDAALATATPL